MHVGRYVWPSLMPVCGTYFQICSYTISVMTTSLMRV